MITLTIKVSSYSHFFTFFFLKCWYQFTSHGEACQPGHCNYSSETSDLFLPESIGSSNFSISLNSLRTLWDNPRILARSLLNNPRIGFRGFWRSYLQILRGWARWQFLSWSIPPSRSWELSACGFCRPGDGNPTLAEPTPCSTPAGSQLQQLNLPFVDHFWLGKHGVFRIDVSFTPGGLWDKPFVQNGLMYMTINPKLR